MDATRESYWNVSFHQLMFAVGAITFGVFVWGFVREFRQWKGSARLVRPAELGPRLRQVVAQTVAQRRLLRERTSGLSHVALSWGFVLLFIGTLVAALDADLGVPIMRGGFYLWFQSLVLDVAGLAATVALVVLIWRRYAANASRLREPAGRGSRLADALIPVGLLVLMISGFVIEGIRIAVTADPWGGWSPVGRAVGSALAPLGESTLRGLHQGLWWLHLLIGAAVVAAIPFTKLAHLLLAPLNLFFTPPRPADLALTPVDLEAEGTIGLASVEQLDAKKRLELDACTECGRCQAVCPAYAAGQPLSPKALILDLRDFVRGEPARSPVHLAADAPRPLAEGVPPLIDAVGPEAVWSCVTCGACVEACPVGITHVPTIVEMRRHLVMELATAPDRLQGALANLDSRGTPFVGVATSRTAWMRDLEVPRMAERKKVELLYWVGCASAFDERGQQIARATATLLNRAGVDYAVLGDEESCTGDAARRMGDEVLFALSAQKVVETLGQYTFDAIMTGCAHCFHSLKNEYPAMGGSYQVLHHTEVLRDLVNTRSLIPTRPMTATTAIHDPCYLGRYNDGYDAPRDIVDAIPGMRSVEPERTKATSFCCGAGGGQTFTTEVSGGRISHARADQLLATGAQAVATACPFCAPMLQDGLGVRSQGNAPKVLDVAEMLEISTRTEDDPVEAAP
ncbi:MAG: heterodisulfide reductase-related iron-sulfur binding cluster [Dermatophilaceae bacterium]